MTLVLPGTSAPRSWCSTAIPTSPISFGASLVGIPLGMAIAVRIADSRVGTGLAWVGRRTLRVYVLHLTALVAAACFATHAVLVRAGLGARFEAPSRLTGHPGEKVPRDDRSGFTA